MTGKNNRQELYAKGMIFIRPRNVQGKSCMKYCIYSSKDFGIWKLYEDFTTAEQRDKRLQNYQLQPDKYIVES